MGASDDTGIEPRKAAGAAALPSTGGTGIVVQTGPATTVARALQAGPGIDITNADGVAGDPVIGLLEMPSAPVELAKFGLPFSSSSWAPAEYIGRSTASSSTPDAAAAGGFVENDGPSYIDLFEIKTQYTLGFDYSVEIWQLDEFGNATQALDTVNGLPIVITVLSGSTIGRNTVDIYEQPTSYTLLVRSDAAVGWNPGQAQVVARRRKTM